MITRLQDRGPGWWNGTTRRERQLLLYLDAGFTRAETSRRTGMAPQLVSRLHKRMVAVGLLLEDDNRRHTVTDRSYVEKAREEQQTGVLTTG